LFYKRIKIQPNTKGDFILCISTNSFPGKGHLKNKMMPLLCRKGIIAINLISYCHKKNQLSSFLSLIFYVIKLANIYWIIGFGLAFQI